MRFNERLKTIREDAGLTQKAMAELLGVAKSTYVKYERGEREPRYDTLAVLSESFALSLDYILGKSDEKNPYISRINSIFDFIKSEEYICTHSEKIDSIYPIISDFLQIIYLSNDEKNLDLLYVLTKIEKNLIELYRNALHIFKNEEWSIEDREYRECVDVPNVKDLSDFIIKTTETRNLLDNYINLISSYEYIDKKHPFYRKKIDIYPLEK